MKRKKEDIIPLKLTKTMTERFPDCWEWIETFRKEKGTTVDDWPEWCYIPIGACQAIAQGYGYDINSPMGVLLSQEMAVLAPWRQHKTLYQFDEDLSRILIEQSTDDIKIPMEILMSLPYPCIYIEAPEFTFFAHLEYDMHRKEGEVRFFVPDKGGIPLHLKQNETIAECIQDTVNETIRNAFLLRNAGLVKMIDEKAIEEQAEAIKKYLQFVLYICSENAEIVENPAQKQIYKRGETVKDTYGEIRMWDVGYKIGSFIKSARTGIATGTGTRKRPHTRRGHWHHYKVGEGRKKTILKWVAPTFINAKDVDALPVSIIEVKK